MSILFMLLMMTISSATSAAGIILPDPNRESFYLRLGISPTVLRSDNPLRDLELQEAYAYAMAKFPKLEDKARLTEAYQFFLQRPHDHAKVLEQVRAMNPFESSDLAELERKYLTAGGSRQIMPSIPSSDGALSGLSFFMENVMEQMSPGWRNNPELSDALTTHLIGTLDDYVRTVPRIPNLRELLTIRYGLNGPEWRKVAIQVFSHRIFTNNTVYADLLKLIHEGDEDAALGVVMEKISNERSAYGSSAQEWRRTILDYILRVRQSDRYYASQFHGSQPKPTVSFEFLVGVSRMMARPGVDHEVRRSVLEAIVGQELIARHPFLLEALRGNPDALTKSFDRILFGMLDCRELLGHPPLANTLGRSGDAGSSGFDSMPGFLNEN